VGIQHGLENSCFGMNGTCFIAAGFGMPNVFMTRKLKKQEDKKRQLDANIFHGRIAIE
jgi:hypothetical protein